METRHMYNTLGTELKPRVSHSKKKAYNFKRQKEIAELYMQSGHGIGFTKKRLDKIKINYDLMNGRVDTTSYNTSTKYNFLGEKFTIDDDKKIVHYPIISQVCQAMIGEHLRRPFIVQVKDLSPYKESFKAQEYNKLLKQDMEFNYLAPLRERVGQEVLQELGETDLLALNEQEQQQIQQVIGERVKALSSKDIVEYMENDYTTPIAKQGQEIIDYLTEKFDLQALSHQGFIHMLPTGEEYYYIDVHRDQIVFEQIMPDELRYGGDKNKTWVQDMDWAVRTTYMTIPSVTEKYAEYLTPSMLKELEDGLSPIDSTGFSMNKWENSIGVKSFMAETTEHGEFLQKKYKNLDSRTKKGHSNLVDIYGKLKDKSFDGNFNVSNYGLKVEHCVFKDDRLFYKVYRWSEEQNKAISTYEAENYEPVESDIKVVKVWGKEVWEATRIAGEHWVKVRPVKHTKAKADNPYELELPYVGKKYFTYNNRTENRSVIDPGKSFQRDFDIQMHRLKHTLKTNLGKLFFMVLDKKPDKMSLKEFFTMIKDFSMVPIQDNKHGASPLEANILKSVDASKMSEIAENINLLEFFRRNIFTNMYFNDARAGALGQYTTTANIESQQAASYNQTEDVFNTHRKIFEKALMKLMNVARLHYKEYPEQVEAILSPTSLQELKAGRSFFYFDMGVFLSNSGFEVQAIETLKNTVAQMMSGQGVAGLTMIVELFKAKTENEVSDIVKRVNKETQEAQQQAQQFQLQQEEAKLNREMQLKMQDIEADMIKHRETLESQERRAVTSTQFLREGNDIDRNNKSDLLEGKEKELAYKREELEEEYKFKREELKLKY